MTTTEQVFRRMRRAADPAPDEQAPPVVVRGFDDYEFRIGEYLRGERHTLGKSLLDVERDLKIRASLVDAIEECDLTRMPVREAIASNVKAYARYLNIDPDWAYARFCEETGFTGVHPGRAARKVAGTLGEAEDPLLNPRAPISPPMAGGGWREALTPALVGQVGAVAALLVVLGYGGWSVWREVTAATLAEAEDPAATVVIDPVAEAMARTAPVADTPLALADAPPITSRETPIIAIDPDTVGTLAPRRAAPAGDALDPRQGPAPIATAELARELAPAAPAEAAVAADARFVYASRPAWIRLSDSNGNVLFEKILKAEETVPVPDAPGVTLRAGNSGSVFVRIGDAVYGPVGEGTRVVKGVDLSADTIRARLAAVTDPKILTPLHRAVRAAQGGPAEATR